VVDQRVGEPRVVEGQGEAEPAAVGRRHHRPLDGLEEGLVMAPVMAPFEAEPVRHAIMGRAFSSSDTFKRWTGFRPSE
jgi:hypothetical protein